MLGQRITPNTVVRAWNSAITVPGSMSGNSAMTRSQASGIASSASKMMRWMDVATSGVNMVITTTPVQTNTSNGGIDVYQTVHTGNALGATMAVAPTRMAYALNVITIAASRYALM